MSARTDISANLEILEEFPMDSLPNNASNIWQALFNQVPNLPVLSVPVPPNLEVALGYSGQARFVAFWWDAGHDELAYADEQGTFIGAAFITWTTYVIHAKVRPGLMGYNLGNHDEEATQVFIIDRETRTAYVGPRPRLTLEESQAFLIAEHNEHDIMLAWLDEQG